MNGKVVMEIVSWTIIAAIVVLVVMNASKFATVIGSLAGTPSGTSGGKVLLVPLDPPGSSINAPGSIFFGPTGVRHYVATGNQTLSQIAASLGLGGWNSIYAIPKNQTLFGAMNAQSAASYRPAAGQVITLPGGTNLGGTHDPVQSGVMAHTLLYHRSPGMPIAAAVPPDYAYIDQKVATWQRRVGRTEYRVDKLQGQPPSPVDGRSARMAATVYQQGADAV